MTELLAAPLTLSDAQVEQAVRKFREIFYNASQVPQVELETKDTETIVRFKPVSESYLVIKPSIVLSVREECAGFEKLKTVSITANNCGLCKGTKSLKFNAKNLEKFDSTLVLVHNLFRDNYEQALALDTIEREFDKVVADVKIHVGHNKKKKDPTSGYSDDYPYNLEGDVEEDRTKKLFKIRIEGLSADQAKMLGRAIKAIQN
jgi:hypothetical protein